MALVIRTDEPTRPADRGQVMFVMALGLALLLVVLSVTINSTVVTGGIGPDGSATNPASNAVRFQMDAREAIGDAMKQVNENNGDAGALESSITSWSTLSAHHAASDGSWVAVDVVGTTPGTAIAQTNESRGLTNIDGNETWTLATDSEVRAFSLALDDVAPSAPSVSNLENNGFHVVFDDGAGPIRVFVYTHGGQTNVAVDSGDGTLESCSVAGDGDPVTVDLTDGRVAGEPCAALDTIEDGSYDIEFRNGEQARGTYSLVVDRPLSAIDDGDFATDDTGPTATSAIYAVTVETTYHTSDIHAVTERRVAPGEFDD